MERNEIDEKLCCAVVNKSSREVGIIYIILLQLEVYEILV